MGLACLVLHNLCIEMGDMIPRNWDITVYHATNKRRPQNEIRDVLLMNNINQKYLGNCPENAKRIRDFIANKFCEEKRRYEICLLLKATCIMTEKLLFVIFIVLLL